MIIENPTSLKEWLQSCLGNYCDADPSALGQYIMALVKKDMSEQDLYMFCLEQLDAFLLKDTKYFVNLLFNTLRTKSYFKQRDTHTNRDVKQEIPLPEDSQKKVINPPKLNENKNVRTSFDSMSKNKDVKTEVPRSVNMRCQDYDVRKLTDNMKVPPLELEPPLPMEDVCKSLPPPPPSLPPSLPLPPSHPPSGLQGSLISDASKKRKACDYRHLDKKFKSNANDGGCRNTPQVAKIPSHLNTIQSIYSHFAKFGNVTNIKPSYPLRNFRRAFNVAFTSTKKPDPTPLPPAASLRSQKDDKKEAVTKRFELNKKKNDYLQALISEQKKLLAKMQESKLKKDKTFLKEAIEKMAIKITSMSADIKKNSDELKGFMQKLAPASTKTEAKALGLLYPPNSTALPAFTVMKTKHRFLKKPASLKIDNRPKKIIVSNFHNKDVLRKHFLQFGEIEKIEESKSEFIVSFNTRKAAEIAMLQGRLLGEKDHPSISWFRENRHSTPETTNDGSIKDKDDSLNFIDSDEDDDEEKDSEARSWRR